ncbi:MAG: hypothetical protein D3923_13650 [Candidatus Electrothrix sp. AR3]|nr:hypothetical protein [Candidatus Electrothrix sp. AR3]
MVSCFKEGVPSEKFFLWVLGETCYHRVIFIFSYSLTHYYSKRSFSCCFQNPFFSQQAAKESL